MGKKNRLLTKLPFRLNLGEKKEYFRNYQRLLYFEKTKNPTEDQIIKYCKEKGWLPRALLLIALGYSYSFFVTMVAYTAYFS